MSVDRPARNDLGAQLGVGREHAMEADQMQPRTGNQRRPKGAWTVDGSSAWLRASCEKSLQDPSAERITLYPLHAVETLR
jgi:aryl-alcohol dehydrogenase-like predicted oxidoreductase